MAETNFWSDNTKAKAITKEAAAYEKILKLSINAGAKDCVSLDNVYEIISKKEDFYKVKSEFEKKLDYFEYSGVEWRPLNYLNLDKEKSKKILEILMSLEELDDVQDTYTNAKLENIKL